MKTRFSVIDKAMQLALQLDLFSEFLIPGRLRRASPTPAPSPPSDNADNATAPQLTPSEQCAPPVPPTIQRNGKTDKLRRILLQNHWLEYELQRSKRRSIGFLINQHGLRITAPRWVTMADIESAIREKQAWIKRKLAEQHQRNEKKSAPTMRWEDGSTLPYLGTDIILRIRQTTMHSIHFDAERRELIIHQPHDIDEQELKDRVKIWLRQEAKRLFDERLPVFAERLNVRYHSMSLSSASTRWGSCNSQGKIRLNWRLIHFPPHIIDYVVAHELAHLREMNHSPRFWAAVQSVFADVEQARQELRRHATADLPQL